MPSRYDSNQVDQGLIAMIYHGGNSVKATESLKGQGLNVTDRTLRNWVHQHTDRYEALKAEYAPQIAARIAAEAEALAVQYANTERKALERLDGEIPKMTAAELANAVRNLATSKALQIDKISSPLRGRPTTITEHRDPNQAIRELARALGKEHILESTAEDITDLRELES